MCTLSTLVMAVTAPSCVPSVPAQSPLPVQQIPRATSARIEDCEGRLAAIGALVRYSTNQAYFILQHLDKVLGDKAVTIYAPDEVSPLNFRIDQIYEEFPDRTFMPMYIQVHYNPDERLVLEHLIDNLAETTLGRTNLELKKNVTIDVFDSDGDLFLRDNAGFIVADRFQLHQVTVDAQQMLRLLAPEPDVKVEEVKDESVYSELIDYDATLSAHNRSEFLEFLYAKSKVYLARWKTDRSSVVAAAAEAAAGEQSFGMANSLAQRLQKAKLDAKPSGVGAVAGYVAISRIDQRVLCLYADSAAVAEALIAQHLKESRVKNTILCTTRNHWTKLQSLGSFKSRVIYRRHTRAVPANIKWDQIFAINVGMNLF